MKNTEKSLIGLGLGLIAGGIAGYYLGTDEGKKMQKKAKQNLMKLNSNVQETFKKQSESVSAKLSETAASAQNFIGEITETVKNKITQTAQNANEAVENAEINPATSVGKTRTYSRKNTDEAQRMMGKV